MPCTMCLVKKFSMARCHVQEHPEGTVLVLCGKVPGLAGMMDR